MWQEGDGAMTTGTGTTQGSDDRERLLDRTMARHGYGGDALIEVLHAAQQLYGYLSPPLLRRIAHRLKLPPSRVLGVATFYHLFRFEPPGEHQAVVCLGTACYAAGATALAAIVAAHSRARGGRWTASSARCTGSCGLAPLVHCDGVALPRATPAALDAYLDEVGRR